MAGRKPRARKAKKPRLYTRYDPTTGQKVRVYADSFEYRDWPSRKPSKKKLAREAFKSDPFGTTGTIAQAAAKRSVERLGEHAATRVLRTARGGAVTAALASARSLAPFAGPLAIAAATIGAAIALWKHQRTYEYRTAGEAINQVSREFAQTQQQVISQLRVRTWQEVPLEQRTQLVNAYKAKIAEISQSIYHAGSLQPSKQIPYGR